jgi:low temperature requirement protein LtrA
VVNATGTGHPRRLTAVLREGEKITSLELFFDLVFVLALTQCTALMVHEDSWAGVGKGLLVLGVMWWSRVGYTWLTSVVDPEEGSVRLAIFAAMAACWWPHCACLGRSGPTRSCSRAPMGSCAPRT